MKTFFTLLSLLAILVVNAQDDKKVPEKKLASAGNVPVSENSKKPESKLSDPSTAKKDKIGKTGSNTPELKLISK